MPETIQSFLARVNEAALMLGESETVDLITAVKAQLSIPQLRILIVGSAGVGRFSVTNTILGRPEMLPVSPVLKAPIGVRIGYGETMTVEAMTRDGMKTAILVEELRSLLMSYETAPTKYSLIEVKTDSGLLKTCELRIESIHAKRTLAEWKELLAGTDYVLLVLRAIALLSEQEREFIRDTLQPKFGLERVAIILNQMDLVPVEERAAISEHVRTFLGPYESQPVLLEYSATQASRGLLSGNIPIDSGYEILIRLVKDDLVKRHSALKSAAVQQALEICLTDVVDATMRQMTLLSMSESDLRKLLNKCNMQDQWLQARIKRTQQRAEFAISRLGKAAFFHSIEEFSDTLKQQIAEEIMLSAEDINAIRHYVPGYLEALWTEFFDYQQALIRDKLIDEMKQITAMIRDDLKELLGEQAANFSSLLNSFDPTPANMKLFLMPRRASSNVSTLATGLQAGGLLLLFVDLPLGLTTIGAGQVIRKLGKRAESIAEKRAIIASTVEAIPELEQLIKQQVTNHFEELSKKAQQAVADIYAQEIERLRSSLEEYVRQQKEAQTRQEELAKLVQVTLPELKELLHQLHTQEAGRVTV